MVKKERWASRALVSMLIRQMKNYQGAAEVVSGSEDVFAMCRRAIEAKIEEVDKSGSVAAAFDLQMVLEEARHEIAAHETWQENVISELPEEDDESGVTGPLRQAFSKSARVRDELLEQVKETYEKYFSGSVGQ